MLHLVVVWFSFHQRILQIEIRSTFHKQQRLICQKRTESAIIVVVLEIFKPTIPKNNRLHCFCTAALKKTSILSKRIVFLKKFRYMCDRSFEYPSCEKAFRATTHVLCVSLSVRQITLVHSQ